MRSCTLFLTVTVLTGIVASARGAEKVVVPKDTTPFKVSKDVLVRLTGHINSGGTIEAKVEGPAKIVDEDEIVQVADGHILIGALLKEYEFKPTGAGTVKVTITATPPQPDSKPVVTTYQFTVE